ncbi:hypothetical protein GCM10011578_086220 [Streptomyces fuscichromogenes]|uniref:Uncharacterized protein n=1 Tax=Streptomyces fuscichromogenes TaxID=1324013 RepID=A0A918CWE7_9ACTN|nr:hypothetical protein GCM10011578_086220 [Streptomyces fuscichromogenes]
MGPFWIGNLCFLVCFRPFRAMETPLHGITSIAQDAYMSTTGEAARAAAMASTGVAP